MTNVFEPEAFRKTQFSNGEIAKAPQPDTIIMNKIFEDTLHALVGMMLAEASLPFEYGLEHKVHANNGVNYKVDFHIFCELGSFYLLLDENNPEAMPVLEVGGYWIDAQDSYLYAQGHRPIHKVFTGINPKLLHEKIQTLIQAIAPNADVFSFDEHQNRVEHYFNKVHAYNALH